MELTVPQGSLQFQSLISPKCCAAQLHLPGNPGAEPAENAEVAGWHGPWGSLVMEIAGFPGE